MSEMMVDFEITDEALKGAHQIQRDWFGPYDVKSDRFSVPVDAIDSFSADGSGCRLIHNDKFHKWDRHIRGIAEEVTEHAAQMRESLSGAIKIEE